MLTWSGSFSFYFRLTIGVAFATISCTTLSAYAFVTRVLPETNKWRRKVTEARTAFRFAPTARIPGGPGDAVRPWSAEVL